MFIPLLSIICFGVMVVSNVLVWDLVHWKILVILNVIELTIFSPIFLYELGCWLGWEEEWDDRKKWFGNDGIDYLFMRLEAA